MTAIVLVLAFALLPNAVDAFPESCLEYGTYEPAPHGEAGVTLHVHGEARVYAGIGGMGVELLQTCGPLVGHA